MLKKLYIAVKILLRFRGYLPQRVNIKSLYKWLNQFEKKDRTAALELLQDVIYFPEERVNRALLELNKKLLMRLQTANIPNNRIIYVQIDDPGSSSPVMLNKLKELHRLERGGFQFIDSKNIIGLQEITYQLGEGAIIYVDDFSGSGKQFIKSRDLVAENVLGNFAEFFLLPSICEEAVSEITKKGVEIFADHIHWISERPLHSNCEFYSPDIKKALIKYSSLADKRYGLGFNNLATMVVLYRNSPNSLPLVLRGNKRQDIWFGLLPRYQDLPFIESS